MCFDKNICRFVASTETIDGNLGLAFFAHMIYSHVFSPTASSHQSYPSCCIYVFWYITFMILVCIKHRTILFVIFYYLRMHDLALWFRSTTVDVRPWMKYHIILLNPDLIIWRSIILSNIMAINYNTRLKQKSLVRQQNAWFDTKKPGSTQKCPVRHKNALPSLHQLTLPLWSIPPPLLWEFFFLQFYSNILFLGTNREMRMK